MNTFLLVLDVFVLIWVLACSYDCIRILTWEERPAQMIANFIVMLAGGVWLKSNIHELVSGALYVQWYYVLLHIGLAVYYPTVIPSRPRAPRVHFYR